jgi:hypothetical protein
MWRLIQLRAKAWTTTFADAIPFLKASFPTSAPTVLDIAGQNLSLAGYLVGAFSVVSSLEAVLSFPVPRLFLAV